MEGEERSGVGITWLVLGGLAVIIYLLFAIAVHVHGSLVSFSDSVNSTPEGQKAVSEGAGALAEYVRSMDGDLSDEGVIKLDSETVLRVLDAVDEYNKNAASERTVSYEYKHYRGMVDSFDPETGEAAVSDWVTEEEVTEIIGRESVLVGTERVSTGYTQEEIDRMAAEYYAKYPTGTFVPPPAWRYVPVYEDREVTETKTVLVEHKATDETLTDQVTLSRTEVEKNPKACGENVFELDWRPVLALCSMIIQDRTEQYGSWEADDDGRFLSEEDVQTAIGFFGYQYSFLDDATAETEWDGSVGRGSDRNAAYRLEINGTVNVGEVCEFTVRRVPRIAPLVIANSYMSYEYEYGEKENGEWVLKARRVRMDGESFVTGCEEMVEGFDAELFVSVLSDLPDSEGATSHFTDLAMGKYVDERTEDQGECPCIGTVVTKGARLAARHAAQFYAGRYGERGIVSPTGANVANVSWVPAGEAMEDEAFAAIYDAAAACVGTKYVFGGNGGPGVSFDCSSFVAYVYATCGYPVKGWPHGRETTVSLLGTKTARIEWEELCPGDLLFFKGTIKDRGANAVSHVAIWLGEGMIAHASGRAGQVTIEDYDANSYLQEHFMCCARMNGE